MHVQGGYVLCECWEEVSWLSGVGHRGQRGEVKVPGGSAWPLVRSRGPAASAAVTSLGGPPASRPADGHVGNAIDEHLETLFWAS